MSNSELKKILIIAHAFPPGGTSATQRPLKYAKYLPSFNWRPFVVTCRWKPEPLDHSLLGELSKETSVSQVFSLSPVNINAMLDQKYSHREMAWFWHRFFKLSQKFIALFIIE